MQMSQSAPNPDPDRPRPFAEDNPRRGWGLSILTALLPIGATAGILADRWQRIPHRFPTHWGFNGQPNGWSNRTPAVVYGPLVLGGCVILLLAVMGELIPRMSPDFRGRAATLAVTRSVLRASAWLIGCLFAVAGMLPLATEPTRWIPLIVAGPIVFSVALIVWIAMRAIRITNESSDAPDSPTYRNTGRYWKAGIFYFNPRDPAVLVPKRIGIGYTFNFGHPVSWMLLGAILLLPLIIPILVHLSRH